MVSAQAQSTSQVTSTQQVVPPTTDCSSTAATSDLVQLPRLRNWSSVPAITLASTFPSQVLLPSRLLSVAEHLLQGRTSTRFRLSTMQEQKHRLGQKHQL